MQDITAASGYTEIRDLFDRHSLLLFKDQDLDHTAQIRFGELFGPIEDRSKGANGPDPVVSDVSNVDTDDRVINENDDHVLHLRSNQLWHTDSTFLPIPALANVLTATVVPSTGGETEFVSTRVAWADMPASLKSRTRGKVFRHRYAHSRQKISKELARQELFTMWNDQAWRSVWLNPVTGEEALYIASHVFAVDGMDTAEGEALIEELTAFATQPQYIYRHQWQVGDVLVWDERATMHRGRPWPYSQARSLASICVTAREVDGLALVRPS